MGVVPLFYWLPSNAKISASRQPTRGDQVNRPTQPTRQRRRAGIGLAGLRPASPSANRTAQRLHSPGTALRGPGATGWQSARQAHRQSARRTRRRLGASHARHRLARRTATAAQAKRANRKARSGGEHRPGGGRKRCRGRGWLDVVWTQKRWAPAIRIGRAGGCPRGWELDLGWVESGCRGQWVEVTGVGCGEWLGRGPGPSPGCGSKAPRGSKEVEAGGAAGAALGNRMGPPAALVYPFHQGASPRSIDPRLCGVPARHFRDVEALRWMGFAQLVWRPARGLDARVFLLACRPWRCGSLLGRFWPRDGVALCPPGLAVGPAARR